MGLRWVSNCLGWVCDGFGVGLWWVRRGFVVGLAWVQREFGVGVAWVCGEFGGGLWWGWRGFVVYLTLVCCGFPSVLSGFAEGLGACVVGGFVAGPAGFDAGAGWVWR